jgi:hypothetical protein
VHVDLFALRGISEPDSPASYKHLAAVFTLGDGRRFWADLENQDLPLGVISPELDVSSALSIVSADSRGIRVSGNDASAAFALADSASLTQSATSEQSTATGDLTIDSAGDLHATVEIVMGAWRGSQVRQSLRTMTAAARQRYFEQLADRLFPGCADVTGTATEIDTSERPLRLQVECTADDFASTERGLNELSSVMPPLSLKNLYGNAFRRKYPLYIGAVLDETTEFRLHLPPDQKLATAIDRQIKSQFGEYSYTVKSTGAHDWQIVRKFRVPVQTIPPENYPQFAAFAEETQRIEQTKISLWVR